MSHAKLIDPATVPFPVEPHFRMRPGLSRHEGPLTSRDAGFDAAQACVADALRLDRLPLGVWDTPGLTQAIAEAHDLLRTELMVTGEGDGLSATGAAESGLMSLRLRVQEDLVFMSPGEEATAVALAVAMPSGWDPAEKLGLSFSRIHAVVPDAPMLVKTAAQMSRTMLTGGPFRRFVWTLSGDDRLSRHPAQRQAPVPGGAVWWRVEQQTTVPLLRSGFCLFLIRVFHLPLVDVLAVDPARPARLVESLRSMTDAVLDYKNLSELRDTVVQRYG